MAYPSIYDSSTTVRLHERIDALKPDSVPLWGKMTVAKMLRHCAVPYQQTHAAKGSWLIGTLAKLFFKSSMTNEVDYRKNLPTAKHFIVIEEPDFEEAKTQLKSLIASRHGEGEQSYEGRSHTWLGNLTAREWSNMLYKHLDHHLRQFGV